MIGEDVLIGKQMTEELRSLPFNMEAVVLYVYKDKFMLEPNTITTNIKTNLIINRKTAELTEKSKSDPIEEGYDRRRSFSVFLGILPVLNQIFLVFVQLCEKICSIEDKDIYQVCELSFIPFSEDFSQPKSENDLSVQVSNYVFYMKNYLLKEGYYFSYEYDLSLSRQAYAKGYPTCAKFQWNLYMSRKLLQLQDKSWFVGLIQGSIKNFKVFIQGKKIKYILITRRSWKKGGTRYNSRGIDTKGHVANFCQTEQIVYINAYCFSHMQIRGSVPAFWKQSGIYAEVEFYKDHEETKQAFDRHFKKLQKYYSNVFCINLLSKTKAGELAVTLYYEQLVKQCLLNSIKYQFYDFHFACKGQKFQRSDYLIDKIGTINKYFGYYFENIEEKTALTLQKGVMRTNCLDCLDRTNLVQSKIAYFALNGIFTKCGFNIKKLFNQDSIIKAADNIQNTNVLIISLKNAWADNGDAISKHYTGTGSTHTNVTRTGRRDLKGIMDHGLKTLGRFYKQYMQDNYKQQVIDILIGEHTETINLAQFESRLKTMKTDEAQSSQIVDL